MSIIDTTNATNSNQLLISITNKYEKWNNLILYAL